MRSCYLTQVRNLDGKWFWLDQDHCVGGPISDDHSDGFRILERRTFKVWEYGFLPKKHWWSRKAKGWQVVGDVRTMPEYNR